MWVRALVAIAACNEHDLVGVGVGDTLDDVPDIAVTPASIDFGVVSGGDTASATVTVRNEATNNRLLDVHRFVVTGSETFTVIDAPSDFRVPPEQERTFTLIFTPNQADAEEGTLLVESNDPDEARVVVPLRGRGDAPELRIEPDPLDLGSPTVGCDAVDQVTLTNVGTFPLTVSDVSIEGASFRFLEEAASTFLIPPEASVAFDVAFTPTEELWYEGRVVVTSNEPAGTRAAGLVGEGRLNESFVDSWTLEGDPHADLLFFVDQSGSMRDDHASLAGNFELFARSLEGTTVDWRILVTNFDDGCSPLGPIDRSTPGYVAIFEDAVKSGGGLMTESGLWVLARALEQTGAGECNEGFLREDALLHAIVVSDEGDHSPGPWEDYLARMRAAKGADWMVRVSAVSGDFPDGCATATNTALPGERYIDAVEATGGVYLSLCSAWAENVEVLADASVRRDTFPLTATPDPATIVVTRNGASVRAGWTYVAESNVVVFEGAAVPTSGDVVTIAYDAPVSCR